MFLKNFFNKIADFLKEKITQLVLIIVYIVGIGITSVLAKLFGKFFYFRAKSDSNWKLIDRDLDIRKMF